MLKPQGSTTQFGHRAIGVFPQEWLGEPYDLLKLSPDVPSECSSVLYTGTLAGQRGIPVSIMAEVL